MAGTEATLAGLSVWFRTEEEHTADSPAEPKGENETKTQILCGCKSRQDPWTGVALSHPLRVLCSLEGQSVCIRGWGRAVEPGNAIVVPDTNVSSCPKKLAFEHEEIRCR